jgi:hypothetical protein
MKKPLSDTGVELAKDIVLACAYSDQSPEEIISFAWKLAEAYELKVEQHLKGWDLWVKEQYRLAEHNREAVRAAQTHCVYCEQALDNASHMDHIQAVKSGGSGEITNLVFACARCNLAKNGQDFWKYLETKTKSVQGKIIRRLGRLDKQIPIEFPEIPAGA